MRYLIALLLSMARADILEEVIVQGAPFFRLESREGAVLGGRLSNFSCFAVTLRPSNIFWFLDGQELQVQAVYDVRLRKSSIIKFTTQTAYVRHSTFAIASTNKSIRVSCLVEHIEAPQSRVLLSSEMAAAPQRHLHATHGSVCSWPYGSCVGLGTLCDWNRSPPTCVCKENWRFILQFGKCMTTRKHRDLCLVELECAEPTDTCVSSSCNCKHRYAEKSGVCYVNTTLGGGCDRYVTCPSDGHCINSVCVCKRDYYEETGQCWPRKMTDELHSQIATATITVLTVLFLYFMVLLGRFLYVHSYTPSVMHDRSTGAWEYPSKSDKA